MSTTKWKSWCRLCARVHGSEQDPDTVKTISDILKKYFHISVSIADNCLLVACKDCVNLVVSAGKFALRCGKASYMFWELSNGKFSKSKGDLVRKLYGLSESEEFSHAKAEEVHAPESKIKYLEIEYVEGHSLQVDSADAHSAGSVQNEEMYVADNIVSDNVESLEQTKAGDVSMEQMENGNSHSEEEEAFVKIEMLDDPTDIDHKESVKKCSKKKKTSSAGFTCALCDMKFIGHKWYDKHMKSRHSSKCAELACSKCPKRFNKRYNLKEHENIHLPDDMRFIKCPECDRKYRTAASLRSHIRFVHTREGVCVCEECGKVFGDMCTLRYHKIVHVQQRLSQCTICPKTFKDITHLKKHMEIHSEEMHECPECGRQFNTKRSLTSHLAVHFANKIYKCHLCKFAFKRRYGLTKHLIVHSGVRPCPCSYCDKAFTDASRKRYHERIYHPKEYALQMEELLKSTE